MPDISDEEARSGAFLSPAEIAQMKGYLHAHRRVLITGELNTRQLKKVALELVKLDFKGSDPILIMLESNGGEVVATQQFVDVVSALNSPVDIIILGDCCSMAVDLVQMCRKRMMLPSARILTHYLRYQQRWIEDDPQQIEVDLDYFKKRLKDAREARFLLYEKRTGLSRERLEEMFRHGEIHGAYFSAGQALELNLVDEVVTDFKIFPRKAN